MQYRREIDGLRAIAVVPVILFHAGFDWFRGGFIGVDVFFVISGYLITSIIISEKQEGRFSIANFYERRARRILPPLIFVMLVCLPLAWIWMLPSQLVDFGKSIMAVSAFVSNVLFWMQSGYFAGASDVKPLLHTWSLAVEEQYYIVFPVVVTLLWRYGQRWLVGLLMLALLASLGMAEWGWRHQPHANFFLAPSRVWELLVGALCAFYLFGKENVKGQELLSLLGAVLIGFSVVVFDESTPFPSLYGVIPVLGTALIILFASPETLVARVLSLPLLVAIGLISYSTYLWHQPLFAFGRLSGFLTASTSLVLIALAFVLGWLSWRYVERPFRNRQRVSLRRLLQTVVLLFIVLNASAFAFVKTDGFAGRYPEHDRFLVTLNTSEQGKYVHRRFAQRELKPFIADDRIKLFVVGDSYGEDIVNALYEAGISERLQISTHKITKQCGNLLVGSTLSSMVDPVHWPNCVRRGWYESNEVRQLLAEADAIWLVSSWLDWQVPFLPETLKNIQAASNARTLVFGKKNFGKIDVELLLRTNLDDRMKLQNTVRPILNASIEKMISSDSYVDVQALICGQNWACPLFDADAALLSYDGTHLTKAGAKFLGDRLTTHPLVVEALKLRSVE